MRQRKHFLAVGLIFVVVAGLTYLFLSSIYQLPEAASAEAQPIDTLFTAHFGLIAILFALVMVFMVYSVFAFRARPGDDSDGEHFHGNTALEVGWTILPLVAVVVFGVWSAQILRDITDPADHTMTIKVVGRQWSWYFEYPEYDNLRTDTLVLPVDQKINLELTSQDVLHSFWVPEFRVKQDLLPGRSTQLIITPSLIGEFDLACAEICGSQHSYMLATVQVKSQADFDSWVEEQVAAQSNVEELLAMAPEARGEQWYTQYGCNACHSLNGTVVVGPSWQGLFGIERVFADGTTTVANEDYIRESILNPNSHVVEGFNPNIMPATFADTFVADEAKYGGQIMIVEDLIAFIKSLSQ